MRSITARLVHPLTIAAVVLAMASPALAQSPREVTVAREAFQAGVTAAQAERWGEAREHFQRSYAINQRLSALMNLATAEENSGELVDAAEHYRQYLERAEDGDANEGTVRQALAALEPRVPKLRLLVSDMLPGDQVQVDGVQMSREMLQGPIPVNPGTHEITVLRDGTNIATLTIQAREGQTIERALTLPEPVAAVTELPLESVIPPVTLPAEETQAESAPLASDPDSGSLFETWWFWTIVGVVVVGGTIAVLTTTASESDPVMGNGFGSRNVVTLP